MAINYKKELEGASKGMILVHEPDTLIKMIVRRIVRLVKVKHAGILLHAKDRDTYVLTVSRGSPGSKVPAGFARMDPDNPLIRFFRSRLNEELFNDGALLYTRGKRCLKRRLKTETKSTLSGALHQMEIFDVVACVPSYFRDELMGILLLGAKKTGRQFARDELDFFAALASDVAMAVRNAQLFKNLELELEKNKRLFIHTAIALAAAIDAKDHYTHGHTARVTELSLAIANRLALKDSKKIDGKFLEHLYIAGLLHDIGKIGIPEAILNKIGPLDQEEQKKMREHPLVGATILQPIRELKESILGVKYHHEKYDGTGYPDQLKGDDIPFTAAIISVADTFDAMTTNRPYRKGLSKHEAVEEIKRMDGKQFNPQVVNTLVELYQEGKI